jgi:hypothetical protein
LMAHIAIMRKTIIITCQSWKLYPYIDNSFIETSLLMLDEKPVGTRTPRRHWQNVFFSSAVNV